MSDVLMLGVSGMRGVVGTTVTPEVVARFAGAVGGWIVEQKRGGGGGAKGGKRATRPVVVLGRDGRSGGTMLRNAAAAGLQAAGCDVVDLGVAMTATVGVVTDVVGDAGIVITASHNPQQWNGLKFIWGGGGGGKGTAKKPAASAPNKKTADEVIARFREQGPRLVGWEGLGESMEDVAGFMAETHVAKVLRAVDELIDRKKLRKAKIKVVLDSVNGAGQFQTPDLLEELGCTVVHLGNEPSGLFPHTPEPTAENLKGLTRDVKKHKAAVGFAQDPDADRLALLDENGRYIGEEYTLVLAARAVFELRKKRKGASVAVNLSTSRMIDDLCAKHGARVIRTAVGEANVVEAMKREGCIIGGEGNGGVIVPKVTFIRDSLGAMGLVLALMAASGKRLSELVDEMPSYAIVKQKVDLARKDDARPAVEKIAKAYAGERVDLQDGVRVDFAARSAWVHVRASNTEPIMRLIAEAPTREGALGLLEEVAGVIRG